MLNLILVAVYIDCRIQGKTEFGMAKKCWGLEEWFKQKPNFC